MLSASGLNNTSWSTVKMDTPSSFTGKLEIIRIRYDSIAGKGDTNVPFWNKDTLTSIATSFSFVFLNDKGRQRGESLGSNTLVFSWSTSQIHCLSCQEVRIQQPFHATPWNKISHERVLTVCTYVLQDWTKELFDKYSIYSWVISHLNYELCMLSWTDTNEDTFICDCIIKERTSLTFSVMEVSVRDKYSPLSCMPQCKNFIILKKKISKRPHSWRSERLRKHF